MEGPATLAKPPPGPNRAQRRRMRAIGRRIAKLGAKARRGRTLTPADIAFLARYGVDPTSPTAPETPHDD